MLNRFQQRSQWTSEKRTFQIGDIVLIKDFLTPPSRWPLATVEQVFVNPNDGLVRSVEVKTLKSSLRRNREFNFTANKSRV